MKRIVVGTDLSPRSKAAVGIAADMAESMGATLHLVTACPTPVLGSGADMVMVPDHGELVGSIESDLDQLAKDLRRRSIDVEVHACTGDAADTLCGVAETVGADLIIVGNKRMRGASRVLGSVPNRVAHRADCSVLIARTA